MVGYQGGRAREAKLPARELVDPAGAGPIGQSAGLVARVAPPAGASHPDAAGIDE